MWNKRLYSHILATFYQHWTPSPNILFVNKGFKCLSSVAQKINKDTILLLNKIVLFWSHTGQLLRVYRCRGACRISERLKKSKLESRGFEASRDLLLRRLTAEWIEAKSKVLWVTSLIISSATFLKNIYCTHKKKITITPVLLYGAAIWEPISPVPLFYQFSHRGPEACITTRTWRRRKPLNQWQHSFHLKAALPLV